jgi:hypothetical protein
MAEADLLQPAERSTVGRVEAWKQSASILTAKHHGSGSAEE